MLAAAADGARSGDGPRSARLSQANSLSVKTGDVVGAVVPRARMPAPTPVVLLFALVVRSISAAYKTSALNTAP
jgi:hypothetical protein